MNWEALKLDARKLSPADLTRHASVSTNAGHKCRECFTCACAFVAREAAGLVLIECRDCGKTFAADRAPGSGPASPPFVVSLVALAASLGDIPAGVVFLTSEGVARGGTLRERASVPHGLQVMGLCLACSLKTAKQAMNDSFIACGPNSDAEVSARLRGIKS